MARTHTYDFRSFVRDENWRKPPLARTITSGAILYAHTAPIHAMASDDSFERMWSSMLTFADWACAGAIFFAGTAWMFGHRTKAIEFIIGAGAGYLVCRHALDIRDFLKTI